MAEVVSTGVSHMCDNSTVSGRIKNYNYVQLMHEKRKEKSTVKCNHTRLNRLSKDPVF